MQEPRVDSGFYGQAVTSAAFSYNPACVANTALAFERLFALGDEVHSAEDVELIQSSMRLCNYPISIDLLANWAKVAIGYLVRS